MGRLGGRASACGHAWGRARLFSLLAPPNHGAGTLLPAPGRLRGWHGSFGTALTDLSWLTRAPFPPPDRAEDRASQAGGAQRVQAAPGLPAGALRLRDGQASGECCLQRGLLQASNPTGSWSRGRGRGPECVCHASTHLFSPNLGSVQKKLPLMALSMTMAESFKELDTDSSLG